MINTILNIASIVFALGAAAYITTTLKLRMRVLASGALFAFAVMKLKPGVSNDVAIAHCIDIAIIICVVYFATVANNFLTIACKLRHPRGASCPKDNVEISTDFPPTVYVPPKDTTNVTPKAK